MFYSSCFVDTFLRILQVWLNNYWGSNSPSCIIIINLLLLQTIYGSFVQRFCFVRLYTNMFSKILLTFLFMMVVFKISKKSCEFVLDFFKNEILLNTSNWKSMRWKVKLRFFKRQFCILVVLSMGWWVACYQLSW